MGDLGKLHVIYGSGKGKTSAVVGMSIRALGAGVPVYFFQFMKSGDSSEVSVLRGIPGFEYYCTGSHDWMYPGGNVLEEQIGHASETFEQFSVACRNRTGLLVADEILNVRLFLGNGSAPFGYGEIKSVLSDRNPGLEVAMTGLACPEMIREMTDYASEVNEIKHPYRTGLTARKGIEY